MNDPNPVSKDNQLQHVAIIMDGNGRWAKQRGLPRIEGHRKGVQSVRRAVEAAKEIGLKYLTLYAFSVENWQRPQAEVSALMGILKHFLKSETKQLIKNEIRLHTIGKVHELPDDVQKALRGTMEQTAHFTEHHLILALNYGARTEVLDAVKSLMDEAARTGKAPDELKWEDFSKKLYTHSIPDPDLLIRTSGETRLSNFLLMQSAYSELYFSPVLWPDFEKKHFLEAIDSYRHRERRFGKTGDQLRNGKTATSLTHT